MSLAILPPNPTAEDYARYDKHCHRQTCEVLSPLWLAQSLRNCERIVRLPSVAALRERFVGKPAFVVNGGPSVAKNRHLLEYAQTRAIVICGTNQLSALQTIGVHPHFCVALDPQHVLSVHLEGAREVTAMVLGSAVHGKLYAHPARYQFTFAGNGNIDAWPYAALGENAKLHGGSGSIASIMIEFAGLLGCDPIVLVGYDLAFGEQYHAGSGDLIYSADGNYFAVKVNGCIVEGGGMREVPAYAGGTIKTSLALYEGIRWLEAFAAKNAHRTLVNATEGGAKIEGWARMPLRLAIDVHAAQGVALNVETELWDAKQSVNLGLRAKRMADYLASMNDRLQRAEVLAEKCTAVADRKDMVALEPLERELRDVLGDAQLFVELLQCSALNRMRDASLAGEDKVAVSLRFYVAIAGACRLLAPEFKAQCERMLSLQVH